MNTSNNAINESMQVVEFDHKKQALTTLLLITYYMAYLLSQCHFFHYSLDSYKRTNS